MREKRETSGEEEEGEQNFNEGTQATQTYFSLGPCQCECKMGPMYPTATRGRGETGRQQHGQERSAREREGVRCKRILKRKRIRWGDVASGRDVEVDAKETRSGKGKKRIETDRQRQRL